jgi:anti-sigma regulatory factor (Ser/Thr protein kinase)
MSAQVSERDDAGFRLRLPATPSSLGIFRRSLRDWLKSRRLSPADIFDVVLACTESLTLVVEDCPRQVALVIEVSAELDGNRLVVRTRDYGLWQESRPPEPQEPLALSLMQALVDSVEVERHPDGQTVTLVRHLAGTIGASCERFV